MNDQHLSCYSPISSPVFIETGDNKFLLSEPVSKNEMYHLMLGILEKDFFRPDQLISPELTRSFLQVKQAKNEQEVFSIVLMDTQHQVIAYEELFRGTIGAASVYPREVVKCCLHHNVAAVILAHCHPSG